MHTADLLRRATAVAKSERELCRAAGLTPSGIAAASAKGKLGPANAALLAAHLGESVTSWTLTALIEAERRPQIRRRLTELLMAGGADAQADVPVAKQLRPPATGPQDRWRADQP